MKRLLAGFLILGGLVAACGGGGGGGGGTSVRYTISGNVGSAGVSLTYNDSGTRTVTSDASGNFTFTVPAYWSGTVTPTLSRFGFSPARRSYSRVGADTSGQDFTAVRSFWVDSFSPSGAWDSLSFKLAYQTADCNVWVLPANEADISLDLLKHYGDYCTNRSWPDASTYVHVPTEYFSEPGNRVNLLFFKMAQPYAGYFWARDFYNIANSNQTNVLYFNIDAAVSASNQPRATLFTEGTLTHESQHLCNAQYFLFDPVGSTKQREMDTWANEFCSTTLESARAGQLDIYLQDYQRDVAFPSGASDFLQWRNDYTQYISASMLGSYLLSQVPDANRPNFFKTFLARTWTEGTNTVTFTSVEDLLATLQDPAVGWQPAGWTNIADFAAQTDLIRNDWAALLKGFCIGLTGQDAAYNTYVASLSSQTVAPVLIPTTAATYDLKPSGWILGKTGVNDLAAQTITAASSTGTHPAYVFVYNATIPSNADLNSDLVVLPAAPVTLGAGQILARPVPSLRPTSADWPFNRASGSRPAAPSLRPLRSAGMAAPSARSAILGAGDPANGGDGISAGYNYCGYVGR